MQTDWSWIWTRVTVFISFVDKNYSTVGVRVLTNGPGDLGSIPGRVIPKTQKMVLDASLLNTQHYKVRIKGKVEQSREGVAPSPTHWCSSYRKGSLRVTLDYGRQLYSTVHLYNVPCMGQTDLFNHLLSIIVIGYFKRCSCE